MSSQPYLSLFTTYRDHAGYLLEWLEFHRLVGVERFFLYDNGSVDDHEEVLAPYLRDGTVVLHRWPGVAQQQAATDDCLKQHRDDSRWIGFIDIDEFLFSPTGKPLPEILKDYEQYPGVGVNQAVFGTSGHEKRPSGLVIESYLRRNDSPRARWIKNIVDPTRALSCAGHEFVYRDGARAVDEQKRPTKDGFTESLSYDLLRINHYYTKSEEELRDKWSKPRADTGELRDEESIRRLDRLNAVEDHTILAYVPALRRALEERANRAPAS